MQTNDEFVGDLVKTAAQQTDGAAVALGLTAAAGAGSRDLQTITDKKIVSQVVDGLEKIFDFNRGKVGAERIHVDDYPGFDTD